MTATTIAAGLRGKQTGPMTFMCRCPAHDDHTPSLSVSDSDGKVLVKCFAGCDQSSVIAALKARALWEGTIVRSMPAKTASQLGPIVAEYIYTDEEHRPHIRVTRHFPKDFRQWRPNSAGGWMAGIGDSSRPLYRLPEVIASAIVFIVEGEKDVESLRDMGFVATCNLMGAGKWRNEYNKVFAGKIVVIIPDCDGPGLDHAMAVYAGVKPFAADVAYIDLETAKDVSDWFGQGHSEAELVGLLESHWAKSEAKKGAAHG